MRILILSQFFAPEPHFKGLPFARELMRRGHEVEVLTGLPNYPGGKLYPGYRVRPWRREIMDGVTVHRVPLYPSHDRSALRRAANYLSFAVSASVLGPWLVKRPDVIYVYHPPVTVGLPAMALRAWHGCPLVYDVQDLWPDTVVSSGMLGNSRGLTAPGGRNRLISALDRCCRMVYRRMDRVVVLSAGFRETLIARGVAAEKIDVIYNWADEASLRGAPLLRRSSAAPPACDGHCFCEAVAHGGLAGRFNVVFAGTMGLVQGLDTVLEAARICAATVPDAQFVFVGGGVDKARLEQRAREMRLSNTLFLPRQPTEAIGAILSLADAALVHLKDDPLFRITIPSKTQAYLAAGRPVLMAVGGDAAELVARSGGGVTCPPENPTALAAAVKRLWAMGHRQREEMGAKGRAFYDEHLSLRAGAAKFERVFQAAIAARRRNIGKNSRGLTAPGGKSSRTFRGLLAPGYRREEERRAA